MSHSITVDVKEPKAIIVFKTTFNLYEGSTSLETLFVLSCRISQETIFKAHLAPRGYKTLDLTSPEEIISKEVLLREVETVARIIREVYNKPKANMQIQQDLF
ncbi:MAG: hypothetical protein A3J55_00315 [Candidatus Ryanbacteria bacterium RIFCSPHIGHO2_02_FULL_45_17b]|uniref:Uncharacterized protein n=1 Tax=Candidatus Ryanbacteria bacterium RIFCSPHIGHO2_01_FULL_45_22 TaxID=1802114 RepID=A0A1G2G0N9_9BACT|nr:MAG: hypothetical protein A2719_02780 [Candidatus Ryanbacteria bacterium RIFCSPHIGHO2_01_FULL_45_22]OGZ46990.1 MAG: hypothetical protein A3J55_00315 [Candidatus Ryanbacteria bacterium RIFCSPHIGHO2_02_FULL_45_17b]